MPTKHTNNTNIKDTQIYIQTKTHRHKHQYTPTAQKYTNSLHYQKLDNYMNKPAKALSQPINKTKNNTNILLPIQLHRNTTSFKHTKAKAYKYI